MEEFKDDRTTLLYFYQQVGNKFIANKIKSNIDLTVFFCQIRLIQDKV